MAGSRRGRWFRRELSLEDLYNLLDHFLEGNDNHIAFHKSCQAESSSGKSQSFFRDDSLATVVPSLS